MTQIDLAEIRSSDLTKARLHGNDVDELFEYYVVLNASSKPIDGKLYHHLKRHGMICNISFYNTSRNLGWIYKVALDRDGVDYIADLGEYALNFSRTYYDVNQDRRNRR